MRHDTSPDRRSIRLRGFDYSGCGGYFLTICTYERAHLFAGLRSDKLQLTVLGEAAGRGWQAIPDHFDWVTLDAFVIMPDHVHGIIWITGTWSPKPALSSVTPPRGAPPGSIGSIVRGFKIGVTKWAYANTPVRRVWQRNYYEHVVRDQRDLDRIRRYIADNPGRAASRHRRAGRGPTDSTSMTP